MVSFKTDRLKTNIDADLKSLSGKDDDFSKKKVDYLHRV
jgi:hypothetical protein